MIWLIKKKQASTLFLVIVIEKTNKPMREFIDVEQQILNPLDFRIKTKPFQ